MRTCCLLVLAAPLPNNTLWQIINSTATSQLQQQGPFPVTINLLSNTSIAEGAPGNPGPQPLNLTSLPDGGSWYTLQQSLGFPNNMTRLPPPPGPGAVLQLSRSLVLQSDPVLGSQAQLDAMSFSGGSGLDTQAQLDMMALQGIFSLPSPATASALVNSSTSAGSPATNTTPPVTLTFSNLTLVNLPPGPYSTYPLGMSTLMMWSVDMDRWVAGPYILANHVSTADLFRKGTLHRPQSLGMFMLALSVGVNVPLQVPTTWGHHLIEWQHPRCT
jgi:hypothetical protein